MFSIIETRKLKDITERILHVPGNYSGGILEMTLVLDFRLKKEYIKVTAKGHEKQAEILMVSGGSYLFS